MKYEFKCSNCNARKIVDIDISKISEAKVICDCGSEMKRVWKASLIVPEYMKADQSQEMSYINDRMKIRPSGKTKVYY